MKTVRIDFVGIPLDVDCHVYGDDFDIDVINTIDEAGNPLNELDLFLNERGNDLIYDLVAEALQASEYDIDGPSDTLRPLHFGSEGAYK